MARLHFLFLSDRERCRLRLTLQEWTVHWLGFSALNLIRHLTGATRNTFPKLIAKQMTQSTITY
jgi:hypothetical protein